MSCKPLTLSELQDVLGCTKSAITWAADRKDGDVFTLWNTRIKRIPGDVEKWAYIVLGEVEVARERPPCRKPKAAKKPGQCTVCDAAVGKNRAIVLYGNTVCQTCHRKAFVDHNQTIRRQLGVL